MDSRDAVGPAACAQCVARVGQGSFRVRQARGVGSPSVPRCACRESAPAEDTTTPSVSVTSVSDLARAPFHSAPAPFSPESIVLLVQSRRHRCYCATR